MCFEIESTQQWIVMHPYMFQMANPPLYQEVSDDAQGVALREELLRFAVIWDGNLHAQGFIQAAQRLHSKALM